MKRMLMYWWLAAVLAVGCGGGTTEEFGRLAAGLLSGLGTGLASMHGELQVK